MILRAVIASLLLGLLAVSPAEAKATKTLLLIGQGPDGHPATTHEFMAGLAVLKKCLEGVEGLEIKTVKADEPWTEGPDLIKEADGVVMFLTQGARWMQNDPRRYDALTQLAARGGGIVALHWAVGAKDEKYVAGQVKLLGGSRGGPKRKYTVLENDVSLADPKHAILRGIKPFRVHDEFYYRLDFPKDRKGWQPLLTTRLEDNDETVSWAWERPDGGRSFAYVGYHFHDTWKLEAYRRLAAQGVLWTLKIDVPETGLAVEVTEDDLKLPKAKAR